MKQGRKGKKYAVLIRQAMRIQLTLFIRKYTTTFLHLFFTMFTCVCVCISRNVERKE